MEKVDRPLGPVVVDIAGTSLTDEEVKILQNPDVYKRQARRCGGVPLSAR